LAEKSHKGKRIQYWKKKKHFSNTVMCEVDQYETEARAENAGCENAIYTLPYQTHLMRF
jgi:hypothetical protein